MLKVHYKVMKERCKIFFFSSYVQMIINNTCTRNHEKLTILFKIYYRTTERGTLSLHLFNVYAIVNRVIPASRSTDVSMHKQVDLSLLTFIPSIGEQDILLKELTFQFASSVIEHHPKLKVIFEHIYPIHLKNKYSQFAGIKTTQVLLIFSFMLCMDTI